MPDILEVEINGRLPVHPADGGPLVAHIGRQNINRLNSETPDEFRARVMTTAQAAGIETVVWNCSRPGDGP